MRVVFLTSHYPRWAGDRSGASLGVLARALVRRGIGVRVIAPSDEKLGPGELDGVPVLRVKCPSHWCLNGSLPWSGLFRLWRTLRSAARQEARGADLIHAYSWIPAGLASPPQMPVVLTVQGSDGLLLRRSPLARSVARRVFRQARVVTTVSREVSGWVQGGAGRHVGSDHIHPMPIDSRGHPWTRGGGGAVVIADLVRAARVDLALATAAVLAGSGHEVPLTIIGDGPERRALEQRAAGLGISSMVRFAGDASAEEKRRVLERADLMLFTVRGDGMALAALEGLISGIPVIACWDSGAAVDIVPQSGAGRLTLPSPEALARNVLELQADPDRLTMARLVGESWRARLAPDHVAELCEGWYRDALAG